MGLNDAMRRDCEKWPGTQGGLSQEIFGVEDRLRHKLIGFRGNRLWLDDAMSIMQMTGGRETIHEMARQLGGIYVHVGDIAPEYDNTDICEELEKVTMALGDLAREARASINDDGKIDADEEGRILARHHQLCTQAMTYVHRMVAIYGDSTVSVHREVGNARATSR
ncbi:hypothetical protein WG78_10980 [Amantichitinum ursilacus]|uniref:Uncharacterized protein n=1 Tax=Amantichitinum ursilacus TaxID=857265 RepID=A0A0N0XIS5_9NEIS|nr:hypothetical protein WG78_10980 [Amantichitinum ursilacus]